MFPEIFALSVGVFFQAFISNAIAFFDFLAFLADNSAPFGHLVVFAVVSLLVFVAVEGSL